MCWFSFSRERRGCAGEGEGGSSACSSPDARLLLHTRRSAQSYERASPVLDLDHKSQSCNTFQFSQILRETHRAEGPGPITPKGLKWAITPKGYKWTITPKGYKWTITRKGYKWAISPKGYKWAITPKEQDGVIDKREQSSEIDECYKRDAAASLLRVECGAEEVVARRCGGEESTKQPMLPTSNTSRWTRRACLTLHCSRCFRLLTTCSTAWLVQVGKMGRRLAKMGRVGKMGCQVGRVGQMVRRVGWMWWTVRE